MHIPQEQLEEFKTLFKDEYGEELDDKQAYEKGMLVINFVKTINRLIAKQQNQRLLKGDKQNESSI